MKKYISFLFFCLLANLCVAQITVTKEYKEPTIVESIYFLPVEIETKTGDIIKGFGSVSFDSQKLRFVKEKKERRISINDWTYYKAKDINKVIVSLYSGKEMILRSIKRKGNLGKYLLLSEVYTNESVSIFTLANDYNNPEEARSYDVLKKDGGIADAIYITFWNKDKPMPGKMKKFFKDCDKVKAKLLNKEYSKTYSDFIKAFEDYNKVCSK